MKSQNKVPLLVRFTPEQVASLTQIAKSKGLPRVHIISLAIVEYLRREAAEARKTAG